MIRAGRAALSAEEVATTCGYNSLRAAKTADLFTRPSFPRPVNQHGDKPGYKMIWDQEQILAYSEGAPVPAVPAIDSPDDLLDALEAAELWGISRATWNAYDKKKPHLIPEHQVVHGVKFWLRRALTDFPRPGKGAGAGRRPGSADERLRTRMARETRLARVAEFLDGAKAKKAELTTVEVAAELDVSPSYARSLLRQVASADDAERERSSAQERRQ